MIYLLMMFFFFGLAHPQGNKDLDPAQTPSSEHNQTLSDESCNSSHCNATEEAVCGISLNSNPVKVQWFQSECHLKVHNTCAPIRGYLPFTLIDAEHCLSHLRSPIRFGCPAWCADTLRPVCGVSNRDRHSVLFKNHCFLERVNCNKFHEYIIAKMVICKLNYLVMTKILRQL